MGKNDHSIWAWCSVVIVLALILVTIALGLSSDKQPVVTSTQSASLPASVPIERAPEKLACPVKLLHPRMEHNLEEDVYATVVNVSKSDIAAIAFVAFHTDMFGDTFEPYKTALTSEEGIKRGHSRSIHWEILMEERTGSHGKPGSSELYVDRVAFADGRVLTSSDVDCDFRF